MENDIRRQLPAVHELVTPALAASHGTSWVRFVVRDELERARLALLEGKPFELDALKARIEQRLGPQLVPVINATGVLIHTNLGRSPWSTSAVQRAMAVSGYCSVEFDLQRAKRGGRASGVHDRLRALTGAEDALVVNNCAAALLLALRVLAQGRKVLVARSDLVEVGGGFRIPDILRESGAELVEVGTTNRTHLRDFEQAVDAQVAAVLQVHHSNFRQVGFVTQPNVNELATLGVPLLVDVGSGALQPIDDEPDVQGALEAGASLVFFSGDKLLGGPQAGIAVGRRALVERMASSALFRALRPDKVALAALEATLDEWLRAEAPPVEAMRRAALPSLEATVQSWRQRLPAKVKASVAQVEGAVGGGSLPGRTYPSVALAIEYPDPMRLARALMQGTPPVVARTHQGRLLLDARSVVPLGQSELLIAALEIALERCLGESSDSENGA